MNFTMCHPGRGKSTLVCQMPLIDVCMENVWAWTCPGRIFVNGHVYALALLIGSKELTTSEVVESLMFLEPVRIVEI